MIKKAFLLILFASAVLKLFSQEPDILLIKGNAKDELGDFTGAIKDYTAAIELNPDYAMAYFNRALTKRKIEDYEGALEDYSKAIEIVPFYTIAFHNRGIVYALIEKFDEACLDWEKAYDLGYEDAKKLLDTYCYK